MTLIHKNSLPKTGGTTSYPPPFDKNADQYEAVNLGDSAGLTQFGVGLETLLPGGISSQRHWHENEDEFLYMLSGEAVLVENDGEYVVHAGDAVGWKAGVENGHHLINRSDQPVTYLIMGTRAENDAVHYPDIDLHYSCKNGVCQYSHKDGTPYATSDNGENS